MLLTPKAYRLGRYAIGNCRRLDGRQAVEVESAWRIYRVHQHLARQRQCGPGKMAALDPALSLTLLAQRFAGRAVGLKGVPTFKPKR